MVKIGVECGEQVLLRHEFQPEAKAGFLFVGRDDFERAAIVGGHEQGVGVFVREVTFETREMLLDHYAHGVVGRVGPTIDWNVDQWLGL